MQDDKLNKARRIIASLLADSLFTDWENRTHSDIIAVMQKNSDRLGLGINPTAVLETMLREQIVFENGTYNDEKIYSLKKAKETVKI